MLDERTAEVDRQIRAAFALEAKAVLERARIKSHETPGYLRKECLIYLIRAYLRRGSMRVVKQLSEILCGRCASTSGSWSTRTTRTSRCPWGFGFANERYGPSLSACGQNISLSPLPGLCSDVRSGSRARGPCHTLA